MDHEPTGLVTPNEVAYGRRDVDREAVRQGDGLSVPSETSAYLIA